MMEDNITLVGLSYHSKLDAYGFREGSLSEYSKFIPKG